MHYFVFPFLLQNLSLLLLLLLAIILASYNHMPETNHAAVLHYIAAILWLQLVVYVMLFPMLNVLYFYVSTFRSTRAVSNMAPVCNSLLLRFPGMFLRYLLNNYGTVLPAPLITGTTFVFTFHTHSPPEITILFVNALLFQYQGL
jgi:hypothetical protein